jgi:aspartate kinase
MPTYAAQVSKLSVFGTGIKSHSGVASRMFRALSDSKINLELISTCEVRINVVVDGACGEKALAALKKEFADALVTGNGD